MIHTPVATDRVPNGADRRYTPSVIAVITTRNRICVGSSQRYGMSPEYHRAIGGSHRGAVVAARIWPTTRPRNSTSSTAMTTAYARALDRWSTSGGFTTAYAVVMA